MAITDNLKAAIAETKDLNAPELQERLEALECQLKRETIASMIEKNGLGSTLKTDKTGTLAAGTVLTANMYETLARAGATVDDVVSWERARVGIADDNDKYHVCSVCGQRFECLFDVGNNPCDCTGNTFETRTIAKERTQLTHDQRIIVANTRMTVGTPIGYYGDLVKSGESNVNIENESPYTMKESTCICADKGHYEREAAKWAEAITVNDGDIVTFDDTPGFWEVKIVDLKCSDPVHFHAVEGTKEARQ